MKHKFLTFVAAAMMLTPQLATDVVAQESNPFLKPYTAKYEIPPFEEIKTEHFIPALKVGIEEQNKNLEAIANNSEAPTFDNTILALEKSGNTLRKVTDVFFNQLSCETSDSLDEMSEKLVPLLTEHSNSIMLNTSLFKKQVLV